MADLGGRVVSLVDRRSGREWLAQGRLPGTPDAWAAAHARFGGAEAFGWDECLPTVTASVDAMAGTPTPLRDHGVLWGRPAEVRLDDDRLISTWRPGDWPGQVRRVVSLAGADISIEYRLTNTTPRPVPFLWSMHPLLAPDPSSRLELPGVTQAWLGGVIGPSFETPVTVAWPVTIGARGPIDWSLVGEPDAGIAAKLYVAAPPRARVVAPDGSALELTWDRAFAPTLGVWLTYGGWDPDGPRVHQVALEPTTSADDDLATAVAGGRAIIVDPGGTADWWVRMRLTPPTGDGTGRSAAS